ncbi:hypothetical protein V5O48_006345 [Marasmius crinis-equi]|uniref:Uncharacterized protein n=1 Tax=Marasmius crinis-equi TaxID=585013 RepID=A0ABR3FK52_9AGAR
MIRRLIDSIYPSQKRQKICFLGLSWTGKTTLLYQLKLGQALTTTIPTIGFNIEDCDIQTAPGKTLSVSCWDFGLGCGNMRIMLGLFRNMLATANAVVWLVDCQTAKEDLEASVEAFEAALNSTDELKRLPVLILATKHDKVQGTAAADEIRIKFVKALKARSAPYFIFPVSLLESLSSPSSGVMTAFDWLRLVLEHSGKPESYSLSPSQAPGLSGDELSGRLEEWLTRASTDTPAGDFLAQFHSINLSTWDHYTHIRIAFLLLSKHGRQKGKDMIFDGIQRYIEQSSPTQTRKRTFHVTMTYFWVQMVHFGIRSIAPLTTKDEETELVQEDGRAGNLEGFGRFLLLNPHVARGDLWNEYYSRDVMLSKDAKESMVLPDKNPLPNLVTQDLVDRVRMYRSNGIGD